MGLRPYIGSLNNVITRVENTGDGLFEKNNRNFLFFACFAAAHQKPLIKDPGHTMNNKSDKVK
jgi:hypothetical protein